MENERKERLCPYPFYGKENTLYGQVHIVSQEWDGESGVTVRVNVSLLNSNMVREELEAVETDHALLYFYEFTGEHTFEVPHTGEEHILKYHEVPDLFKQERNTFRRVQIIPVEQAGSDTYENDNRIYFEGELLFSASPILSHKTTLVIEEGPVPSHDWKNIKKIFDHWDITRKNRCITDDTVIRTKLNNLFYTKVTSACVDIYHAAQANCICCTVNGKKIMYDVGITRDEQDRNSLQVQSALGEIARLQAEAVFLSHWDLDHILGVCYNPSFLMQKLWIAPDFEKLYDKIPLAVQRLCNYLLVEGKSTVCLIDTQSKTKNYFTSRDDKISIYLGTPRAAYGINRANNGGLLLRIENQKSILLPGDCENTLFSNFAAQRELDYVVIPHHGSYMSDPFVKGKKGKVNVAYICRGKHPGHCNYDSDIKSKYRRKNFKIVRNTMYLRKNKYSIKL